MPSWRGVMKAMSLIGGVNLMRLRERLRTTLTMMMSKLFSKKVTKKVGSH
jgi:hypothetical protein